VWQRVWDERGRSFQLIAVAEEAPGETYVRPLVAEQQISFPVIVDRASALGAALRFRMVPSGFFIDENLTVRYRHVDDFDIADPRLRWNLDRFLNNEQVESPPASVRTNSKAMKLFAEGVSRYAEEHASEALALWRRALDLDPDNFLIRSQIWVAEHPERFYPAVDLDWQYLQLEQEGYDTSS
jgi:hypothetical protein